MANAVPATQVLADFVAESRWDDIPPNVRHEGVRALLNTVGCALGGCHDEAIDLAVAVLSPYFGPAQASVIGRRERLDILHAAFLNAAIANVLEYDDTHLATVIHPARRSCRGCWRWRTPLAAGAHAAAILDAFILGIEIACRVGNRVIADALPSRLAHHGELRRVRRRGGGGRILGLDARARRWALGQRGDPIGGARRKARQHVEEPRGRQRGEARARRRRSSPKRASRAAPQAIEGRAGSPRCSATTANLAAITDGLGEHWEMSPTRYKPYPCGVVLFPVIDACLGVARADGLRTERIERIVVRGHPLLRERTDRRMPKRPRRKVSLQHSVAVALLFGRQG